MKIKNCPSTSFGILSLSKDKLKISSGAGFTLLELLVVIAIIGVISNIAVAVVQNSREDARIAGAKQFAQQVHQSFGATEDVRWTFENVSGNQVLDESGNNYHGTFYNNSGSGTSNPLVGSLDAINGNAISLNGTYDRLAVQKSATEDKPFTISLWAKAEDLSIANDQYIFNSLTNNFDGFNIILGNHSDCGVGKSIYFQLVRNPPAELAQRACFGSADTKWHYLTATFEINSPLAGQGTVTTYFDGKKIMNRTNPLDSSSNNGFNGRIVGYRLGAYGGETQSQQSGYFFKGKIDEFNFYYSALSQAEIEKLYAEGKEKLKLAGELTD